jgi:hypothetical protein
VRSARSRPPDRSARRADRGLAALPRKGCSRGRTITDPLAEELLGRAADWRAVLAMPAVFGPLGHDARFIAAVGQAREALAQGSLPG